MPPDGYPGFQYLQSARVRNFAPTPLGATNPAPTTVPPIDSTANAIMNIGSTISWRPPH